MLISILKEIFHLKKRHELVLNINFHTQYKASVDLKTNTLLIGKNFSVILLLTNYLIRNLYNLNQELSDSLAEILGLFAAGEINILKQKIDRESDKEPKLVENNNLEISGQFRAMLVYNDQDDDHHGLFQLYANGFGEYINYYSFYSVILLLKYLVKTNKNNKKFINEMRQCSKLVKTAYEGNEINLENESGLAYVIAMAATSS